MRPYASTKKLSSASSESKIGFGLIHKFMCYTPLFVLRDT
jgi:hypothetical protein